MSTEAIEFENQKEIKEFLKLSLKTLTLHLLHEFLIYSTCVKIEPETALKMRFIN